MKADTHLMNNLARKCSILHELTPEESRQLKQLLISIYQDVDKVCKKNNLTLMLAGGSALGAVRHKGFIPWDDDLDLLMLRKDYRRLIDLCKSGALGRQYEFTYPDKLLDSKNAFLKIYNKGTINEEIFDENSPFPHGVYIDIFPLDSVPKNKILRQFKGFIADVLQYIAGSILLLYSGDNMRQFMMQNTLTSKRYRFRVCLGKCCKQIAHHRTWIYLYDKFVASEKKTGLLGIPTGRKHYCGEVFPYSVYFPVSAGVFETLSINLPNDIDRYLQNLYGNYMEIPDEDKRERHFVIKFKI